MWVWIGPRRWGSGKTQEIRLVSLASSWLSLSVVALNNIAETALTALYRRQNNCHTLPREYTKPLKPAFSTHHWIRSQILTNKVWLALSITLSRRWRFRWARLAGWWYFQYLRLCDTACKPPYFCLNLRFPFSFSTRTAPTHLLLSTQVLCLYSPPFCWLAQLKKITSSASG